MRDKPAALLDYYAAATFMANPADTRAPAMEVSLRGYDNAPCNVAPCGSQTEGPDRVPKGPHPMGIVLRYSGNIYRDGTGIPERDMCGEGIGYSQRLPVGDTWPIVTVRLTWTRDYVEAATMGRDGALIASRKLRQGLAPRWVWIWTPDVPDAGRGIGWARAPWLVGEHSGTASLRAWTVSDPSTALAPCP